MGIEYLSDLLRPGDDVCDMHNELPTRINDTKVRCVNHSRIRLTSTDNRNHYPATDMVRAALKGCALSQRDRAKPRLEPLDKIAYVICVRYNVATCVYSYDGLKYGQFEIHLDLEEK